MTAHVPWDAEAPMNAEPVTVDPSTVDPARERKLGMLCHLTALLGVVFPGAVLIEIVGPLAVWLVNKEESPFARDQGAESVNFQITMTILYLCCIPLMLIGIGFVMWFVFKLMNLVLVAYASYQASQGERFRYPFNMRFLGADAA